MIKIFSTQQGLNLRNALFKNEVRFVSRQEVCGRLTASFSLYLTPILLQRRRIVQKSGGTNSKVVGII